MHGNIRVAAHRSFVHITVARTDIAHDRAQLAQIGARFFRRTNVRTRHDFHQRDARAVQIDKRFAGVLIVHQLARVLFQMQTFDTDAARFAVFQINVNITVGNNRVIGLRNLIPVRQVGIVIVLRAKMDFC